MPHALTRLLCPALLAAGLLCCVAPAAAQALVEDFDDGFTAGLGWAGDLDAFRGAGGQLQLDDQRAGAPGRARAWVPAATRDSACYELAVRLEFSPSGSNRAEWWLAADRALDASNVEGYVVRLGGISGADDAYELYYVAGGAETLVLATAPGSAAADPVVGDLTVCGSPDSWSLTLDDGAGGAETVSAAAPAPLRGVFTGLDLRYTASRSDAFFFDDLRVAPLFVDTEAPELVLAQAVDARTVVITASEPLDASAGQASNYRVDGAAVASATLSGTQVTLTLPQNLPNGTDVEVVVDGWTDLAGNTSDELRATVRYVAPVEVEPYDVVISELMADPTPAVGLPEVEYVELSNLGSATVLLSDLRLATTRDTVTLPAEQLAPGEAIALSADAIADDRFTAFSELPTLVNGGTTLSLLNSVGALVDVVAYTPAWHAPGRDDGGVSLERIDLNRACVVGGVNWSSSTALAGGTPAARNSVAGTVNLDSARITSLEVLDPMRLRVALNVAVADAELAFVSSDLDLSSVEPAGAPASYTLTLGTPLLAGEQYGLRLAPDVRSCLERGRVSTTTLTVGLAIDPEPGDWELNEIMYDPLSGDGRYLELVNVSDKLLSSGALTLAVLDEDGNVRDVVEPEREQLVAPGGYLVYSDDAERLAARYPRANPTTVLPSDVPTLGAEECLRLFDPVSETIYWTVCYSEDWHNLAYANTDGVSLERISLAAPAGSGDNWTSAASSVDFGTPGAPNSQSVTPGADPSATFALAAERLSPDADGFEDLLVLTYNFEDPGTLARFEVYDVRGRGVRTSTEDTAPGRQGVWTWDGTTDDGDVAAVGTYVVRVTYFTPTSSREVEYLPVSLLLR